MKSADVLLAQARAAWERGDVAAARSAIERARRAAPRVDIDLVRIRFELACGDFVRAAAICREALERAPREPTLWGLLAQSLARDDPGGAERAWEHVLALDPANPEAWFNLGNARAARGDWAGAIAACERVLERSPDHPGTLVNLGLALDRNDEPERAEAAYRRALARSPRPLDAIANLAYLLFRRERFAAALALYDELVARAPEAPAEVWNNRGVCQRHEGRREEALASFHRALALAPDAPAVLANTGFLECEARRFERAQPLLQRAHALEPSRLQITAQLLDLDLRHADWRDFERRRDAIVQGVAALGDDTPGVVQPFAFLALCDDPDLQRAAARSFAWRAPSGVGAHDRGERARPHSDARVRLGFVASSFAAHPVPRLVVALLERLDRGSFDLHAYAWTATPDDAVEIRVRQAVGQFNICASMPTDEVIARIRADAIDVLFDLDGQTYGARPQIFAARAAPVQVNFIGHAGTLGTTHHDFIVADHVAIPPAEAACYDEKLWWIDPCYLPSDPDRAATPGRGKGDAVARRGSGIAAGEAAGRAAHGLPATGFVFLAPSAAFKILPAMFDVWMRLLSTMPASVLWLRAMPGRAQDNLRAEALRRGVSAERLVFASDEPIGAYLARLPLADLVLDTFPFGAHTSVNDALFAGVPVVTLAGRSMASRASAAQLCACGLDALVATSHETYLEIASGLCRDEAGLARLRSRLREPRTLPLFDMDAYARRFAASLQSLLHERRASRAEG